MDWNTFYEDARQQAIDATNHIGKEHPTSEDVISYYKREYPGSKTNKKGVTTYTWQSKLADDLHQVLGIDRDSVMRRFQSKRGEALREGKISKKHQDEYELLGGMLPSTPPKNGYHVHYEGGLYFSKCEPISFSRDITGEDADEVAQHPDRIIEIAIMIYMQHQSGDELPGICDEHGDPEITVTANPDSYRAPTYKKHKSSVPFIKRKKAS